MCTKLGRNANVQVADRVDQLYAGQRHAGPTLRGCVGSHQSNLPAHVHPHMLQVAIQLQLYSA